MVVEVALPWLWFDQSPDVPWPEVDVVVEDRVPVARRRGPGHVQAGVVARGRRHRGHRRGVRSELPAELQAGRRAIQVEVHLQPRVLRRRAEVPGVVVAARAVHAHVPGGVDAGVAGGRLQLGGGVAGPGVGLAAVNHVVVVGVVAADAEEALRTPLEVAVGDRAVLVQSHQPARYRSCR